MTNFRVVVASRSINVLRGNEFVMSIPLRVWQPRVDKSGKTTWFSQERSAKDRRALIDALVRAIDEQSGIEAIRHLVRAVKSTTPNVAGRAPDRPVGAALRTGRDVIFPRPSLRAVPPMRGRPRTTAIRPLFLTAAAAR